MSSLYYFKHMKIRIFLLLFFLGINLFGNEIIYQDSRFILIKPSKAVLERNTIHTYNRNTRERKIQKFDLRELTADTIQAAYYGPLKNQSSATIIVPQYVSTLQIMFPSKTTLATQISGKAIRKLYKAILSDSDNLTDIVYEIFLIGNKNYTRYILYGKDKFGRNVCYIYNLGQENKGIVLFYPDKFSNIFKQIYKSWNTLGWNTFIKNFVMILSKYNSHLNIIESFKNSEKIYIITYK